MPDLTPFDPDAVCVMCAHTDIATTFMPSDDVDGHLVRRCGRCGFAWDESPVTAERLAYSELVARYEYLAQRTRDRAATWPTGTTERRPQRWWGLSSDALVAYALGWTDRVTGCTPADRSDLDACERSYERATRSMQERMLPTLIEWRALIAAKYPAAA